MTMKVLLTFVFALALSFAAVAADIKAGAIMQVKPNSIWFQDKSQLAQWQKLKKAGNAAALSAYEAKVLGTRDAWQFINQLEVKILDYEPAQHRVNVEMLTEGRMQGTDWLLDPDALVQ